MSVQFRLLFGFLLVFAVAALVGLVSFVQLNEINGRLTSDIPRSIEHLNSKVELDALASKIRYNNEVLTNSIRNFVYTHDLEWLQRYYAHKPEQDTLLNQLADGSSKYALGQLSQKIRQYEQRIIAKVKAGNDASSLLNEEQYQDLILSLDSTLQSYFIDQGVNPGRAFESSIVAVKLAAKRTEELLRGSLRRTLIFLVLIIIISIAVVFFVRQSIINPIDKLIEFIHQVGKGDLSQQIEDRNLVDSEDEIGDLARTFNQMTSDLYETTVSRDELEVEVKQRKQAEAVIKEQAEHLRRSNSDLEQFAYVASHDLQEPLRTVASYIELFEERYKSGKIDGKLDKYVVNVTDGITRMRTLIGDLLNYSRLGREDDFEELDFNLVLGEVLKNLSKTIEEKRVVINHDKLPLVNANKTEIGQLLQNLISNAIKFGPVDKEPEIKLGVKTLEGQETFYISDNGIGIKPDHYEKIFIIFQRLNAKRQYPGTGIGLAKCKKIVEHHGGRIWLDSEPEQGTTFYFTLNV